MGSTIKPVVSRAAPRRLVALVCLLSACVEGPEDVFEREAMPVLEGRCATAACHGVSPGEAWPEQEGFFVRIDGAGRIADPAEARRTARERIVTIAPARLSSLLRIPMPAWAGGGPHAGGAVLVDPDDDAMRALERWIDAEPDGSGGEDLELDALETQFGETVLPGLVRRCGFGGCHGPTDIGFTSFPARPDPETGAFSPVDVRAAYDVARKHLDLWSDDPRRARLLRKPLGLEEGGLAHRGGVATFFPDAPPGRPFESDDARAILDWARAERDALGVADGHAPTALLFVAGSPAPRAPWRIEPGPVGSDLFVTPWPVGSGPHENLTAALHPGAAVEVRDPAVSHDGRTVVFAMRAEGDDRFALHTIDLVSRAHAQLTAESAPGSFVQPTFAPDGRVIAAWDGHGEVGADADGIAPELVAIAADGTLERLTFTPAPEVSPSFLAAGKTRGEMVFGTRRMGPRGPEAVLFRFPLCHDPDRHGEPEYHVQFGATVAPQAPLLARDLPDGRQVMIVLDEVGAGDDRGRIALLDRSLGPLLSEAQIETASMGGYRTPLVWLTDEARHRDPAVLPDGRVLVSDDAIVVIEIVDGPDGTRVSETTELLRMDGLALRSPVPVFSRPPEDTHPPVTDPTVDHGFIAFRDVAVLEALYGRAEPHGERIPLESIAALRLVEWGRASAATFSRDPLAGTPVGLTDRPPARWLADVAVPEDRSAWIRVPARTPMLLQLLDARGMVIGNQLDRWYFAEGAEIVPGGTNVETYAHDCSGCHGAMSGRPEDAAAPPPDALSSASVTLARYALRDRRRELPPTEVPDRGAVVDWVSTIGPAFAEGCASTACHGGDAPAAALALDGRAGARFDAGYEGLLERFVDRSDLRARRSALVERLLGAELDAPSPLTGQCPPGGASDALVREVARWVEIGAFYDVGAIE